MNRPYKHNIKNELIIGSIHSINGPNTKPTKSEVYLLAAQIQDKEDMNLERAMYSALLSYDYYYCDYYCDYYYHNYYDYYYYYDYYDYSKEQKVIALLFLSTIFS